MRHKIFFILLTIVAIICTFCLQAKLKSKPQVYFIIFSFLTTLVLFSKEKVVSSILYNVMIGLIFFITYFSISMWITDSVAPDRATAYLSDRSKIKLMDFTFIYAVSAGLILSIVSVFIYARNKRKSGLIIFEKYFSLTTLIVTIIGYCVYKL